MKKTFTVVIEQGEDGYLIGDVVELPGCHTQAKTNSELMERVQEAIQLYLSEGETAETKFIGLQKIEVDA